MTQLRKNKRKELQGIVIRIHDNRNFKDEVLKNVSSGGVFIRTDTPAEVGEKLKLTMLGQGSGEKVTLVGEVVWRHSPDGDEEQGMGVRFEELDEQQKKWLNDFIERQVSNIS